ncbi:MAG: hypothetical protein ACRDPB_00030, partial [Nocardioidaceae bacterium]
MDTDLLDRLRTGAPALLGDLDVDFAYLLGSRVVGRARPDRDFADAFTVLGETHSAPTSTSSSL